MSFATFALALTLFWAAIHAIHHTSKSSKARSLLPTSSTVSNTRRRATVWNSSTTQLFLKSFHLRVKTTAWNVAHDGLAASLKRGQCTVLARVLTYFYDLGTVLGVVGMLAAVALLCVSVGTTALSLKHKLLPSPLPAPFLDGLGRLYIDRRSPGVPAPEPTQSPSNNQWIQPIIPGVTVPFAHLPVILFAVFLAQLVHEFGHAITAAIEAIPILSAGASITVILPAAFVTLPAAALEALPPRARARIIAAGPFHNLILWLLLASAARIGLGNALWSIGFKNVSNIGRVVIDVDIKSPLYGYLPPGSLITKLDDYSLGTTNTSQNPWSSYLIAPISRRLEPQLGWCAGPLERPELCCSIEASPGLSCFTSSEGRGCLDPIPILTSLSDDKRCNSTADCPASLQCVRPDGIERLLRVSVRRPSSQTEVVLWSGPREEVWNEVQVGTWSPRTSLFPVSLPVHVQIFVDYLIMGTLSLFFLNLLPLPSLDGAHFLETILQMSSQDEFRFECDLEALGTAQEQRGNARRPGRWKTIARRSVPRFTIGLFVLCILLEAINMSA